MRRPFSRATALAVGTIVMLINGVIYAWSIYSVPFSQGFGWTSAQLGMGFTVTLAFFCLGGVLGGGITPRLGAGATLPAGGAAAFAGYLLCIFLQSDRLWLLYCALAVSGAGVGLVYNGVLSAVVPRFPEKKGFASGVLLMGFGASSLLLGTAAAKLISSPGFGWHLTYILTGAVIFASTVIGAPFIRGEKAPAHAAGSSGEPGLTAAQMLRTGRFWIYFAGALIGTGFGTGLIAHGSYIFVEGGAAPQLASVCVGFVNVMNGLGRIIFGSLHDRLGFKVSLTADALLYIAGGAAAALSVANGLTVPLIAAMMLIGACYGAVPTISSAVAGEFFGPAHYGQNLSILNLNILLGSFASTIAGGIQTSTGSYAGAFWLFTGCEVLAFACFLVLFRTKPLKY